MTLGAPKAVSHEWGRDRLTGGGHFSPSPCSAAALPLLQAQVLAPTLPPHTPSPSLWCRGAPNQLVSKGLRKWHSIKRCKLSPPRMKSLLASLTPVTLALGTPGSSSGFCPVGLRPWGWFRLPGAPAPGFVSSEALWPLPRACCGSDPRPSTHIPVSIKPSQQS